MNIFEEHIRPLSFLKFAKFKPKQSWLVVVICSLGLLITSCGDSSTSPNGGENGGGNDDPPAEPTFTNVQEIFNNSCGGSNCHLNSARSGVQLNNYENVMNSEGVQYGELVVQPNDADGSPLVDKIESDNPQEGERMPQGGPYLSNDEIDLIKEWINNGAENN